jgi:hypothetical protein
MMLTPILSRTLRLIVVFALLLAGCDSSRPTPDAPQFDLTGYWSPAEPIACEFSNLNDLLEAFLVAALGGEFHGEQMVDDAEEYGIEGEFNAELSAATLSVAALSVAAMDSEFRIEQMGNDLEITDDSDVQLHGTIIGDQVRFSHSEEQHLEALRVDIYTEVRATVLDEDRMALILESDLTVQIQDGEPVTSDIMCTFHAVRQAT